MNAKSSQTRWVQGKLKTMQVKASQNDDDKKFSCKGGKTTEQVYGGESRVGV
jgi:hypothetical protein